MTHFVYPHLNGKRRETTVLTILPPTRPTQPPLPPSSAQLSHHHGCDQILGKPRSNTRFLSVGTPCCGFCVEASPRPVLTTRPREYPRVHSFRKCCAAAELCSLSFIKTSSSFMVGVVLHEQWFFAYPRRSLRTNPVRWPCLDCTELLSLAVVCLG
jgi:hypothetical protein